MFMCRTGQSRCGWRTHGEPLKAFLLAAGEGRRLRPLTDSVPKCLVPIRGTPLLAIWLRLLERHGVSEVLINLHYLPGLVRDFLSSHKSPLRVKTVHEESLLGSAGTVTQNRDFVGCEESFLIAYADNLTAADLTAMTRFHSGHAEPLTLGAVPTDKPREKGTVIVGDDGRVLAFEEKAAAPRSNVANAGIYVARQALFEWLPESVLPGSTLDFGHDVLPAMVPHLAAYPIGDFLMDIGTPDDYARAQAVWPGLPF